MNPEPSVSEVAPPQEICGFAFVRWLKLGKTALCKAHTGKLVVLKQLDADCLLEGDLHPDVRERLARIRELAHGSVQTLISVMRDDQGRVYLVWEFIEGMAFETWICDPMRDDVAVTRALRDLVTSVEGLHVHGIIHGALHAGNVIVDEANQVRVLDLSPLLFNDEREDSRGLAIYLLRVLSSRGEAAGGTGLAIAGVIRPEMTIRDLSRAISLASQGGASPLRQDRVAEQKQRRSAIRLAMTCALTAGLIAVVSWWALSSRATHVPEASPEAMQER